MRFIARWEQNTAASGQTPAASQWIATPEIDAALDLYERCSSPARNL